MIVSLLVASTLTWLSPNVGASRELYDYLKLPDSSFSFEAKKNAAGQAEIDMISQTWQGIPWKNHLILQYPRKPIAKGTGILFITGDGPRPGDYRDLALMTEATGLPTAMLFNIPNQPLYGMKEDDLIAHSFEQYLATGDASWPLLFPMAKSALRAMDAIQATSLKSDNPIRKFVVTGASKRGWTTWLTGASGDRRVIGIAPMVFDILNIAAQTKHQFENWGYYSEQIQDYTRRGIQQKIETTERGRRLSQMVDPYSYRNKIRMPTLIVKGSNDRYWNADALDLYFDDLRQPKWVSTVPNAGHSLGNGLQAIETIGAFARSLSGVFPMPNVAWDFSFYRSNLLNIPGCTAELKTNSPGLKSFRVWMAMSKTLDFRESKYNVVRTVTPADDKYRASNVSANFPLIQDRNIAIFSEANFVIKGRAFTLSSPTKIFHK